MDGDMMAGLSTFLAKHAPVAAGLLAGTAAKFGRMMATDQKIKPRHVFGHFLMMGAVGLAATYAVDILGIDNANARAFTAAIFAIAANDVIKWLATRAWKRFLQDPAERAGNRRNDVQAELSAAELIKNSKGQNNEPS